MSYDLQENRAYELCDSRAYQAFQKMARLTNLHHHTFRMLCAAIPGAEYQNHPIFKGEEWYGMIKLGQENPIHICIPWTIPKTEWEVKVYTTGGQASEEIADLTLRVAKEWAKQIRDSSTHLVLPLYVANL